MAGGILEIPAQNPIWLRLQSNRGYQALKRRADAGDPQAQYDVQTLEEHARSGAPMNTADASPAPAPSRGTGTATARKPLPAAEQQNAAQIAATVKELSALRDTMKKIGPDAWNRSGGQSRPIGGVETAGAPTRWWQLEGRKLGMTTNNPDDLDRMIGQLITLKGQTEGALMKSAGTRNYQFVKDVHGHLPMPAGDYKTNMENFDYLLSPHGPYQQMLTQMGVPSVPVGASGPSSFPTPSASATPDPVAAEIEKAKAEHSF